MVISVNEIIDSSLNYNNYINEQDMFYEVQCILNEGAPADTAKKKIWISRVFDAIIEAIKRVLNKIKEFLSKKKKTAENIVPETKVTEDEIEALKINLSQYITYQNLYDVDITEILNIIKDCRSILLSASCSNALSEYEHIVNAANDIKKRISYEEILPKIYKYNGNVSEIEYTEIGEKIVFPFFINRKEHDILITKKIYDKAISDKKMHERDQDKYLNDLRNIQKGSEDFLDLCSSIRKKYVDFATSTDNMDTDSALHQIIFALNHTYQSYTKCMDHALSVSVTTTRFIGDDIDQCDHIITLVNERINKVKPKQESSIYSNLKLI